MLKQTPVLNLEMLSPKKINDLIQFVKDINNDPKSSIMNNEEYDKEENVKEEIVNDDEIEDDEILDDDEPEEEEMLIDDDNKKDEESKLYIIDPKSKAQQKFPNEKLFAQTQLIEEDNLENECIFSQNKKIKFLKI